MLAQLLSAAGYGFSARRGSARDWWAGSLTVASVAIAVACAILAVSLLGSVGPSSCASLSTAGARWLTAGVMASLVALGGLSAQAARFAAGAGRGGTLAAVLAGEAAAGTLAVVLFL